MELDEDDTNILSALRANPKFKACIAEMLDIIGGDTFEALNNGDDAEDAVVNAIQKTGTVLLQGWSDEKRYQIEETMKGNSLYRMHKKKAFNGTPL